MAAPALFSPNIKYLNPPDVAVDTGGGDSLHYAHTHVFSGAPLSRQLPTQIRSGREENVCHNSEQLVDELEMLQFRSQDYNQCSISAFEFNMTASLEPALPWPGHHAAPGGLCLVVEMFQQDAARAGEAEELTRGLLPTLGLTLLPLFRTEHHNLSRLYIYISKDS